VVTIFVAIIIITQMSCYQIKLCLSSFLVLFSYISDHLRGQNMDKSSRGGRKLAFEGFTYLIRTNKILKVVKRTGNVIFNRAKVE